jgi:hypothetical protein
MGKARCSIKKALGSDSILAAVVGLSSALTLAAQAQQVPQPCPDSALAPWGIAPSGPVPPGDGNPNPHCGQNGCIVSFKNYKWWTAYNYTGAYYNYQYYYNGGLRTSFAPEHVFVDDQGLHLVINDDVWLGDPNNPPPKFPWTGGEAALMYDSNNAPFNLEYGDYLISAKPISTLAWNTLDPNVAVGMFTYERYGPPPAGANGNCGSSCPAWPTFGDSYNPSREIDLAEISRWGWDQTTGNCPFDGKAPVGSFDLRILCRGNAQFATQDFSQSKISVQRYDIGSITEVTLVMQWRRDHVKFLKFNRGGIHLGQLPSTPDATWTKDSQVPDNAPVPTGEFNITTPAELSNFIPHILRPPHVNPPRSCARFHLNFWMGNNINNESPHPPPTNNLKQEVVITNFEYSPEPR